MSRKVMIVYATNAGSTAEVAQKVAEILGQTGLDVEVRRVSQVGNLAGYHAVVLGTAIRMGKPIPEATKFVERHRTALAQRLVACFSVGITPRDKTPESLAKAASFLEPLLAQLGKPVAVGYFAGKIDYNTLDGIWRKMAAQDNSGDMSEGDWRDWPAIKRWAEDLGALLTT